MKCGALLRYQQQKTKDGQPKFKKNGEPRMHRTHCVSPYSLKRHGDELLDGHPKSEFTRCDGELRVSISNPDGCCCGYSLAEFEIEYECKACGNTFFPELPRTESDLEEFMQSFVSELSEAKRKKRLDAKAEFESMSFEERLEYFKSKSK
tara:strand:- start:37138 stop:37587 length:450 start_codon:yes stop_codon:yes gene_type:complete